MKSIHFLGACGMVTGSSYLFTADNGDQILIDLGMFQGAEITSKLNYETLSFNALRLKGVVVTHAHMDHCGRLPLLIKTGYSGKIYMTPATKMITGIALLDGAKIAAEESEKHAKPILYTEDEVEKLMQQIETVEYDESFQIESLTLIFRNAGHILGSASIEITDTDGKKIVFSGDLGNSPEDMIKPTEKITEADYVVMESTYGDRLHEEEDPSLVLQEEINEVEKNEGVLLIPSFSIERAQELLHRINHLKNEKKIGMETKVFLDSPMAIKITEVFRKFPNLYNKELTAEIKSDDPFDFPGLTLTEKAQDSKAILLCPGPKVIISGSGMMHGGRILHHALNYLADSRTRLLMVGYQASGTLGHLLLAGNKKVRIYNQDVDVIANIREIDSMSCHADQKKLLQWLSNIKGVSRVFLTHGEDEARKILAEKIKTELKIINVDVPLTEESYSIE